MKKILCLTMVFLMIFVLSIPCFAAVDVEIKLSFDKTKVEDDLKNYNLDKFVKDPNDANYYLVDIVENGYSKIFGSNTVEYGLYVYLFKPSGNKSFLKSILPGFTEEDGSGFKDPFSQLNQIQYGYQWKKDKEGDFVPTYYAKAPLKFVSCSSDGYFYKFKVNTDKPVFLLENNKRYYAISGVELANVGDVNAVDYRVGYIYEFSGYLEDKSFKARRASLMTIDIECHQTSYLSGDSAKGAGYSNQINSVYFNLPNEYEKRFGSLYQIDYEYVRARTSPMIITDNQSLYDKLIENRGKIIGNDVDWALIANFRRPISGHYWDAHGDFVYGYWPEYKQVGTVHARYLFDKRQEYLTTFFLVDDASKIDSVLVTAETIEEYFVNYPTNEELYTHKGVLFNGMSADLFELGIEPVITHKTVDERINMDSYADTHSWWEGIQDWGLGYIFNKDMYDSSLENIPYIEEITSLDLFFKPGVVSNNLYISENDVEDLASVVNQSETDKTYILRYAVANDYYTANCAFFNTYNDFDHPGRVENANILSVQETVYLNFDIISFTFKDGEDLTVIPVVSSPTNGFTDIKNTAPEYNQAPGPDWGALWDALKKFFKGVGDLFGILLIVALVVGVILLFPLVSSVFTTAITAVTNFFNSFGKSTGKKPDSGGSGASSGQSKPPKKKKTGNKTFANVKRKFNNFKGKFKTKKKGGKEK